ncbi:IS110 family transposase, partial [Candidatus Thiosymbion oneisti]|uniref:IS110 family transposase n=1 Tax=Candidatus Thiosymbion oneisti TaxID=589554 RepID=UPI001C403836
PGEGLGRGDQKDESLYFFTYKFTTTPISKGRYKCVEFKQVDWREVANRLEGGRVVVAVDVAKEDFVATLLTANQEAVLTMRWHHPRETGGLLERLVWLGQGRQLEAVLEPRGTYGDALVWRLRQAGLGRYRVSPKWVHDASEVYAGVPSLHDAKAAYLIGRLPRQGVSQAWPAPAAARREVAAVPAQLRVCKGHQQSASNRLKVRLSRHWPECLGILGLATVTLPALIHAYGDPAAVVADPQGAAALMRRSGRAGRREEKLQALLTSAHRSLGVPCPAAERERLQWLAADLLEARRQVPRIERELACRVKHEPVRLWMAAVVGTVHARSHAPEIVKEFAGESAGSALGPRKR